MSTRPDFPDWISPMLVKELRQGLRSRAFLFSFLALQAAMIVLTFMGLLLASQGTSATAVSVFFWIIIGLPVLLIMPGSGMNAISGEIKENTLELIFLSRLSARRIVIGKWLAVLSQTLLLLSAILPYLVLRYYLGGINIVGDLIGLGWMLLGSALLTGLTIGLSPNTSRAGRAILPIGMVFGLQFFGILVGSPLASSLPGPAMGSTARFVLWGIVFCLGLLLLISLLEFGAQKIAPAAENHSTPKRIAAIAAAFLCGIYAAIWPGVSWLWVAGGLIILPVAIGAVCEPIRVVAGLYRPFARRGFAGRLLARVLYPGWPAGVPFTLLLLLALFLIPHGPFAQFLAPSAVNTLEAGMLWSALMTINVFGFFFVPAALMQIPRLRIMPPMAPFLLFQVICAVVALLAHLADSEFPSLEYIAAMIPTCSLLLGGETYEWAGDEMLPSLIGSALLTLTALFVLFVKALPSWKAIRALETKAADPLP